MLKSNNSNPILRSSLLLVAAFSLTTMLNGCASFQKAPLREPVTRQLPPPPSYLKPQPVPVVKKGDDAIVVIKERGNVIKRQNRIIVGAKKLWEKTKKTYSESVVKRRLFGQ